MHDSRQSVVVTVSGISGGLFFTLLSGLLCVKASLVLGIDLIHFGFPFAWLSASRSLYFQPTPWHYSFLAQGFIADFITYGLLTVAAVYLYLITTTSVRRPSSRH